MSKIDKIRNHYVPRVGMQLENFEVLDWASAEGQQLRFQQLPRFVDVQDKSILDVGCGLADLPIFLKRQKLEFEYYGVDVIEQMLEKSRYNYPEGNYACMDVFSVDDEEFQTAFGRNRFDIVFCSGTLNLNLGNNMQFISKALKKMLSLAKEYMVVTLLHARQVMNEPEYFSYFPADVLKLMNTECSDIQVVDDYLYNDFTLICRPKI